MTAHLFTSCLPALFLLCWPPCCTTNEWLLCLNVTDCQISAVKSCSHVARCSNRFILILRCLNDWMFAKKSHSLAFTLQAVNGRDMPEIVRWDHFSSSFSLVYCLELSSAVYDSLTARLQTAFSLFLSNISSHWKVIILKSNSCFILHSLGERMVGSFA